MEIVNNKVIDNRIPNGYEVRRSELFGTFFWIADDFSLIGDEFETPEKAIEDLFVFLKPKTKPTFSSKTWEEKQAEAKRKRDEANKAVLRSYRIK